MQIKYIIFLVPFILVSCMSNSDTTSKQSVDSTAVMISDGKPASSDMLSLGKNEIKNYGMTLTKGEGSLSFNHGTGSRLIVSFNSPANKKLSVKLSTPDPQGNIRVTQIISPDKKSDGPFDRNMKYTLTQSGEYQLIIAENMMAGDPWSGQVDLKMTVK